MNDGALTPCPPLRVPTCVDEMRTLVADRPSGWELLCFAGHLSLGRRKQRSLLRSHRLALPSGPYRRLREASQVSDFVSEKIGELGWIVEPLERVFTAKEEAFGAPGEPGDPDFIKHFADWLLITQRRLIAWAADARSVGVPDEFEAAVALLAHSADTVIDQIEEFVVKAIDDIDRVAPKFAGAPSNVQGNVEVISMILEVSTDEALFDEVLALLRDAWVQWDANHVNATHVPPEGATEA